MSKACYCSIIQFLFVIITGLRNDVVGSDTTVYYIGYENLKALGSLREAIGDHTDIAYYTLAWLYAHAGLPFWSLTLTVAAFFYYTVTRFIRKYSPDATLSFLILMAFNFFQFSMTGIRQTISFGFVLLALYDTFKPHYKIRNILIYILIGTLFHNSCVIFLLILPMLLFKNSKGEYIVVLSLLGIALGFILKEQIVLTMLTLGNDTRFAEYNETVTQGGGTTTYLMYVAILLILLYTRKSYIQQTHRGILDFLLLDTAIFFQASVRVQPIMFRVAWYFSIALIIILPQIINVLAKRDKPIANTLLYLCVLYMYLAITMGTATVLPYKFFWQ